MAPSIAVHVDHHHERKWFTSNDKVTGSILLDSRRPTPFSGLDVVLEGLMKIHVEPPEPREETLCFSEHSGTAKIQHSLFQRRAKITPVAASANALGRSRLGQTCIAFAAEVPLLAACCQRNRTSNNTEFSLPPSMDVRRGRARVSVKYQIRVVLKRPGVLERDIICVRELALKSLAPPDLEMPQADRPIESTGVLSARELGIPTGPSSDLPQYSPSIMLHMGLPSTSRLRPEQPLDLALKIFVPPEVILSAGGLWIAGLRIRLRGTLSLGINHTLREMLRLTEICAFAGRQVIETDGVVNRFVIPKSLWQDVKMPWINSTFRTCCAQYSYELEAVVKLHAPSWTTSKTISASIPVEMQTGPDAGTEDVPPAYSEHSE